MSGGKMIQEAVDLAVSVAALMLSGCASGKTEADSCTGNQIQRKTADEKKIQIGLTVDSFVIETVDPRQRCICGNSKGSWEQR